MWAWIGVYPYVCVHILSLRYYRSEFLWFLNISWWVSFKTIFCGSYRGKPSPCLHHWNLCPQSFVERFQQRMEIPLDIAFVRPGSPKIGNFRNHICAFHSATTFLAPTHSWRGSFLHLSEAEWHHVSPKIWDLKPWMRFGKDSKHSESAKTKFTFIM